MLQRSRASRSAPRSHLHGRSDLRNLQHQLYDAEKALTDGSVARPAPNENHAYCACCSGEPDATILACFHQ